MEEKQNKSFWDEKYSTFDASEKVEGDLFLVKIMPFLKKDGYEYNFIFHEKKKIN